MIDLSKRNSTLIRMVKDNNGTKLYQVSDEDLQKAKQLNSVEDLKQAMYEVLRFNPYICESFYADEVLLVEGPTEEIIIRGILQKIRSPKDLFVVNCGTVNNIPFYQKVYRKFAIRSHVICDTDSQVIREYDEFKNPSFSEGIQKSIYDEHFFNCKNIPRIGGVLRVHETTFEVAHQHEKLVDLLKYPDTYLIKHGKPFNANKYWCEVLDPNFDNAAINDVPIISHLNEIVKFIWT